LATDVTMPRLSDSMEEGTVLKWLVDEGGEVKRGEALVEIETDKANMTYEADTDGTLVEIVAKEGDTLAIGEVIARIGEAGEAKGGGAEEDEASEDAGEGKEAEGEDAEEGAVAEGEDEPADDGGADEPEAGDDDGDGAASEQEETEEKEAATATATEERPSSGSNGAGADGERVKASPVARRMARELGVEIAQLEGSGPGGRIVKADVEAAAKDGGAKAEPQRGEAEPAQDGEGRGQKAEAEPEREKAAAGAKGDVEYHELSRLQQVVTRRMAESKATAPDFALSLDVDMTLAVELRTRLKDVADPVPSFNDMVVKACANALREHPRVNGSYRDGKFELYSGVNVGMAVAAADALVVPTIFDADSKSLGQIARDARGLIEKVRDQKITPPEVSGGTFTVSNLGMYGIESFTAIINPPQAALLAVGALAKKPAVDESGRVVARDQMTLTLICDHRILYGADGAQFLARVRELLEQPLSLAL
jgi:pyruvate dehydrogenase E2 component (dihydrolipoamide acetyltransferase)